MNSDGNFKMKCVGINGMGCNYYTVGKIYKVIDGFWVDDDGDLIGYDGIKTIEDVNEFSSTVFSGAIWELVEDETSEPIKNELSVLERMEKVANILGLKLDEKFNIVSANGTSMRENPFTFTEYGLLDRNNLSVNSLIGNLLTGKYKIQKLPWNLKEGDYVYFISNTVGFDVINMRFEPTANFLAMLKCGWLFKSKEEAEANKERVIKEIKKVINYE